MLWTVNSAFADPEAFLTSPSPPVFLRPLSKQLGDVAAFHGLCSSSKCSQGYLNSTPLSRIERLLWALTCVGRLVEIQVKI